MIGVSRFLRPLTVIRTLVRIAPAPTLEGARTIVEYLALRSRLRRVDGFCTVGQGLVLFWLARFHRPPGPVVEIGSWTGLSTIVLARGAGRAVTAIDPHEGGGMTDPRDSWEEFRANVRRFDAEVDARRQPSDAVAAEYGGPPVTFLYVDGWHAYEAVRADIAAWLPHLGERALVVFDDYTDPDWGVGRAVDETVRAGRLEHLATAYGYAITRLRQTESRPVPGSPPEPRS
jgi:predicted O-methyltransferase YrrM